jgi:RimJ/RimL family protein N-acetyltransferase
MFLRLASPADLPALLDVQEAGAVRGLGHIFPQQTHPFPRDEIGARWLEEIADPSITVYLIEDDEQHLTGFSAVRADEFLHFGTAVQTWGTGLAQQAHDEVLVRMAATGVTTAHLQVFEENRRARRFYEKLGWIPTGRRRPTAFAPHPVLLEYSRRIAPTHGP